MTDPAAPSSRAVLLGVHAFAGFPGLDGVAKNIPGLVEQLTHPERGLLRQADCEILPADSPRDRFLTAVSTAAEEASDLLLVYYAGHGHHPRGGQGLLLATKESSHGRKFHSIDYNEIRECVDHSLARHKVVIVDCCYSGYAVRMGGEDRPEDEDFGIEGACVLTSAAATEESLCTPAGSVFTLALTDLLRDGITGPLGDGRRGEEQRHLTTGDVLTVLRSRLADRMEGGKEVPEPRIAATGEGFRIPLARNRAFTGEKPAAAAGAAGRPARRPPGLGSVIPQESFVGGLGGFERNLTPECLPYVSPGQDHDTEPSRLFRRLRASDDRGVLLTGAAGTGKTRTVLEVGRVALDEGWRVLHLRPGGKESVTTEVVDEVLAEGTPALVVMDYLHHYVRNDGPRLDLTTLRYQLLPAARLQGIKVAFLATARPGWLRKSDELHLYELFDELTLRQDEEFQRRVAEQALTRLAPTAVARLGMDRMWEICGHRPVIALLIAREVERRFEDGSLPDLAGLRASGELSTWLRSRLEEDDLGVVRTAGEHPRATAFQQVPASDLLVAAAAAATACPQRYAEVVAAARAALPRGREDALEAEEVVETLLDLGWLQRTGPADTVTTAHDIVCDQLAESVILPSGSRSPDRRRTSALLDASLTGPRTLGRYATNLARLMNDLAPRSRDAVSELLDRWFTENAAAIGDAMRRDADTGGYALGALVYGPPWSQAAVRNWQEIAGPWLDEYGDHADARHLLHSGLSRLPAESAALLVPTALRWLDAYGWRQDASYVLGPLLSRTDLPDGLSPFLENAIGWIKLHGRSREAHFVLSALVTRGDLAPHQVRKAVPAALHWCENTMAARQTGTILYPLLVRRDLTNDEVRRAFAASYGWVGRHHTLEISSRVVVALLEHPDLPREEIRYAATLALEWLEHHGETRHANRVLHPVLGLRGAGRSQLRQTVDHALRWLSSHAVENDADFLIRRLLEGDDLTPEGRGLVTGFGVAWLKAHAEDKDPDFLIRRLLEGDDLTPEGRGLVTGFGVAWLEAHAEEENASFIMSRLLSRSDLAEEQARLTIGLATSWLELHGHKPGAGFVLQHLLGREDIPAFEAGRAVVLALGWLSAHQEDKDASYVLPALLARPELVGAQAEQGIASALAWLRAHHLADTADRVLRPLLRRAELKPAGVRSGVRYTARWLEQHRRHKVAGSLLGALLARDDLTTAEAAAGVEEGLTWLERHCPGSGTDQLLPELLRRPELTAEQRGRAAAFAELREREDPALRLEVQRLHRALEDHTARTDEERLRDLVHAVEWLEENATERQALHLLTTVLGQPALQDAEQAEEYAGRVVASALAWLERHGTTITATYLIQRLLKTPGLTDAQLDAVVTHSLRWLVTYEEQPRARFVLELLLTHTELDERQLDDSALLAIGWLRHRVTTVEAGLLAERLLECPGLVENRVRDTVAMARAWLARHHAMKEAGFVLTPLVARGDLTDGEWEWVLPRALEWLRSHRTSRAARRLLVALAKRGGMGPAERDTYLDTALVWLENHGHAVKLHRTLRSLLDMEGLSEAQTARLADYGLWWIRRQETAEAWCMLGVLAERPDLPADRAADVDALVTARVSADPTASRATFVLEPRLTRLDVPLAQRAKTISWSLAWLEHRMPHWRARFLLRSLLVLEDLSAAETRRVVEWSVQWLEHHGDGTAETFALQGADAVLGPLLAHELDEGQRQRLAAALPPGAGPASPPPGEPAAVVPSARAPVTRAAQPGR
ncbi:caspase family protein [Streptomyces sp. NPDC093105]|uniref:caspase, EACC1-associated type n=1 Tax=Streptomyces sp. NPDC093105 TaxID=3366029 RepID=UPI0037FE12D5